MIVYSKLYTREDINKTKEEEILKSITNKIKEFENEACDKDISIEEITIALKGMNKNKSPGIDGLTVEVFTQFWDILKTPFHKVVVNSK